MELAELVGWLATGASIVEFHYPTVADELPLADLVGGLILRLSLRASGDDVSGPTDKESKIPR